MTSDHVIWTSIGVIYSGVIHCTNFDNFPGKGSKDIEQTTFFQKPAVLTLTINGRHVITVLSLATFQQRGREILSWQHLSQQFDFDLWPCDLKINRGYKLFKGIHYTKFNNFLVMGSWDIEPTTFERRPAVWPWPLAMWSEDQLGSSTTSAPTVPSLATFKQMGVDITWSTDRPTDQPTNSKTICPLFSKRGIITIHFTWTGTQTILLKND